MLVSSNTTHPSGSIPPINLAQATPAVEDREPNGEPKPKKQKTRGQNTVAQRKGNQDSVRAASSKELCNFIAYSGMCQRENCKSSHEVKDFWATRSREIVARIEAGSEEGCPNMKTTAGVCNYVFSNSELKRILF